MAAKRILMREEARAAPLSIQAMTADAKSNKAASESKTKAMPDNKSGMAFYPSGDAQAANKLRST
jgi:hypothetical protein